VEAGGDDEILGTVQAGGLRHQRPAHRRHRPCSSAEAEHADGDEFDGHRDLGDLRVSSESFDRLGPKFLVAASLETGGDPGWQVAETESQVEEVVGLPIALPQVGCAQHRPPAQLGQIGCGAQTFRALRLQGGLDGRDPTLDPVAELGSVGSVATLAPAAARHVAVEEQDGRQGRYGEEVVPTDHHRHADTREEWRERRSDR
jgi:hypothetical protein